MEDNIKKIIEVNIGFNIDTEEIEFIISDFMKEEYNYKEPTIYTAKLIEMALEKWIRERIGIFCPDCNVELNEEWSYCPNCGYDSSK